MPEQDTDELIYLYGITAEDAPEPPASLTGLEGGPVRLVRTAGVAAVTGRVPAESYGDEPLGSRLDDLAWVGQRGLAHEGVLDWFAERAPIIPLSLFSLHADEDRLRERVAADAERHRETLARLADRREWGVKLWRGTDAAEHLERFSPGVAALTRELEAAPQGRRYLLEKKQETLRAEELRTASKRLAHRVYGSISEAAGRCAAVPLPGSQPEGGRVLLLHAAFLVPNDSFEGFHRRVSEVAGEVAEVGFEVELTGPWPPYHFTTADGS